MSRKALEMKHLILYTGSKRRTWKEGSYIEESGKHAMEGSGNTASLL
jgi:hypothetical protein